MDCRSASTTATATPRLCSCHCDWYCYFYGYYYCNCSFARDNTDTRCAEIGIHKETTTHIDNKATLSKTIRPQAVQRRVELAWASLLIGEALAHCRRGLAPTDISQLRAICHNHAAWLARPVQRPARHFEVGAQDHTFLGRSSSLCSLSQPI